MKTLLAFTIMSVAVVLMPMSATAQLLPCANCEHWTEESWMHDFNEDAPYAATQGTGFHSGSPGEGKCYAQEPHGHTNNCTSQQEQEDLLALSSAVSLGDATGVEMIVLRSESIRWSEDGTLLVEGCEGNEFEVAMEWFSASPLYSPSRLDGGRGGRSVK